MLVIAILLLIFALWADVFQWNQWAHTLYQYAQVAFGLFLFFFLLTIATQAIMLAMYAPTLREKEE